MTDPSPEAAYRSYWFRSAIWAVFFIPVAGFAAYVRNSRTSDGWAVTGWTVAITLAVSVALWLLYVVPADIFYRRVQREHPDSVVFAATRCKGYDAAVSQLTEDHFSPTYLSAIVADSESFRILSRKGGVFTIPWTRVSEVAASTTRDFGTDYPCVTIAVTSAAGRVSLPLRAHTNPWKSAFMSRPTVIRSLVERLVQYRT